MAHHGCKFLSAILSLSLNKFFLLEQELADFLNKVNIGCSYVDPEKDLQ